MVIFVAVVIGLLINFVQRDTVDQINITTRILYPRHSEGYIKYIFHVLSEELDEFQQQLPEEANEESIVSLLHGTLSEESDRAFQQFLDKSSSGKAVNVIIVEYTTAGDSIYKNVLFDGELFFAVVQDSRNGVNGESIEMKQFCYDYINIITHPETGSKFVILTNDAELTFEKLRNAQIGSAMESIDSYQLFSYSP